MSSSTSPSSQPTDRQTNGQTRTQPASTSSSVITSSNGAAQQRTVVQSSEAQSSGTPAHAVIPTSSVNSKFLSFFFGATIKGGLQPKKTERYRKFQIWDWFFSVFFLLFSVFFGFSILANFDWFNGFLLSGSCWL